VHDEATMAKCSERKNSGIHEVLYGIRGVCRGDRFFLLALLRFTLAVVVTAAFAAWTSGDDSNERFQLSKDEQAVLDLTNQERAKQKLEPLKPNPILFRVARDHSANMAKKRELKHDLDDKTPGQRVKDAGYVYQEMAENIASGMPLSPKDALELWMKSEQHKANILKEAVTEIGIGLARNDKGEVYFTQVFAAPLKK
jgi:uncharacterized protein YkwD